MATLPSLQLSRSARPGLLSCKLAMIGGTATVHGGETVTTSSQKALALDVECALLVEHPPPLVYDIYREFCWLNLDPVYDLVFYLFCTVYGYTLESYFVTE
eukprot:SAG11_NODE_12654_length_692_cov_1.376054_1_plen_101_part_00